VLRGCLLLLLVFGTALAANWALLRGTSIPAQAVVVGVLALLATLWIGSMQGLWQALQPAPVDGSRSSVPSDGDAARLTGTIHVDGPPVLAPFTGRPTAYLEYRAYVPARMSHVGADQRVGFRGMAAARVSLDVGGRRIPLDGLPRLPHWPEDELNRDAVRASAAAHLASTRWSVDHGPARPDLAALGSMLEGEMPSSRRRDIIDGLALEYLELQPGRTPAEHLVQTLSVDRWQFAEQRVEPGATVTVIGTWRTAPQRIDVGLSLAGASHAIHPGGAPELARRERGTALAFVVVLGLLTVASHLLVHLERGAHWRALLDWFRRNAS
jgi:hypothetical protein